MVLRACLSPSYAKISNAIPVPSPQIYWLHMVYAALGAICFTLVSKAPPPLGRGAEGTEGRNREDGECRLLGRQGVGPQPPFPFPTVQRFH